MHRFYTANNTITVIDSFFWFELEKYKLNLRFFDTLSANYPLNYNNKILYLLNAITASSYYIVEFFIKIFLFA